MRNIIDHNELLYRAIKRSKPEWYGNEKPIPAMFKQAGRNSVDRDGGREESEIIRFMNEETFPDKSVKVSKSKGDLAESVLHIEKEPSEIKNEKSLAD